jgi:ABC-type glycerol-3-phosphate transport system substrate-binding protein
MHSTRLLVFGVAVLGCALALAACGGSASYDPEAADTVDGWRSP